MQIGMLAGQSDVSIDTIRFYEKRGLLPKPARTSGGMRLYAADDVRRLRFIRQAQQLGFTLDEIGELLALHVDSGRNCGAVQAHAQDKLDAIEEKIRALRAIKRELGKLLRACVQRRDTSDCPILDALARAPSA